MSILQNIKNIFSISRNKSVLQNEYSQRIKNCFPAFLTVDIETVLSIIPLDEEVYVDSFGKQYKIENAIHPENIEISLLNESITLTGRIFFSEPTPELENNLSGTQKQILNCIYTRHFDGHIREKRLKYLLNIDYEWVLPFKLQLLGEFVIEILFELDKHITDNNSRGYKQLTLDNKKYWQQTKSRIVSWWDTDYKFPNYPWGVVTV